MSADKEAQGLARYTRKTKREVTRRQVEVRFAGKGEGQIRKYDGLALKRDGTYEGVEVKSGSAYHKYYQPSHVQRHFDERVSYANPACGK